MTSSDTNQASRPLPVVRPAWPGRPLTMPAYEEIPRELGDALRGIINRFEMRSGKALPKALAVTSPLSGEGVTTVSQSLATIIAHELGRFVCWVDCGWMRADRDPEPHAGRRGLIEILEDQSLLLAEFESSPDLPQLVALSPGPVPDAKRNQIPRTPEFERLLAILDSEFDHVVFDIPPVLSSPNGLALLRQTDATLLVVRQHSTTTTQVRQALDATRPTPPLAVVLNHFETNMPFGIQRLLGG